MNKSIAPNDHNHFHEKHACLLCESFERLTGKSLLAQDAENVSLGKQLFEAEFVVVSHGTEADPVFNYANQQALRLFEMHWSEFVTLPSRLSAEPVHQDERARLMAAVTSQGYIDDYAGIRIAKSGKRFRITSATVWNVIDADGAYRGQAATFSNWACLNES
ncbi:MAG: MEKHLA domain-containing protein [Pseudomonadota bacterium]